MADPTAGRALKHACAPECNLHTAQWPLTISTVQSMGLTPSVFIDFDFMKPWPHDDLRLVDRD
jgi:hypothetical protein